MAETPERDAPAAHAAAVRLGPGAARRCAAPTAASATWGSSTGSAPRCRRRRSRPTSSSASRGRPRRTSRPRWTSCAASRFAAAFTFQYSIRPGTPAATMPDQVPKPVVQERYERLVALVEEVAWAENRRQVGRSVEVMFADGEGRKDAATARMSGRARDNRLVHVAVPEDPRDASATRGPGRRQGHLRRPAPPDRRRRADEPATTPGGDAWQSQAGPARRRRPASTSACRPSASRLRSCRLRAAWSAEPAPSISGCAAHRSGSGGVVGRVQPWRDHGTMLAPSYPEEQHARGALCRAAQPPDRSRSIAAHQQYVACAVYYDSLTMPQMARFFYGRHWRSAGTP